MNGDELRCRQHHQRIQLLERTVQGARQPPHMLTFLLRAATAAALLSLFNPPPPPTPWGHLQKKLKGRGGAEGAEKEKEHSDEDEQHEAEGDGGGAEEPAQLDAASETHGRVGGAS